VSGISRATLELAFRSDGTTVYVGPTAYNFLNVFLRPPRWDSLPDDRLTEHPLHALACRSRARALRVFAILASQFAFWWWHINGDGFHLTRRVIHAMPIGRVMLEDQYAQPLAELGETLWRQIALEPIVSTNRGRTSLGFSALPYHGLRRQIDALLVDALGLSREFVSSLERFVDRMTTAEVVGGAAPCSPLISDEDAARLTG
jgi:hypothetical protein